MKFIFFGLSAMFCLAGALQWFVDKSCEAGNAKSVYSFEFGPHMLGGTIAGDRDDNGVHMIAVRDFWSDFSGEGWRKRFFVRNYFRLPVCKGEDGTSFTVFYAFSHKPLAHS